MANGYGATHQTPAGSDLPILLLIGSATIRLAMHEFTLGSSATPADLAGDFRVHRASDAGTGGTSITPVADDPLSATPAGTAKGGTFSGAITKVSNSTRWRIPLNQRAFMRWVAAPGREFVSAAASAAGILINSQAHGGTPVIDCSASWFE